MTKDNNDNWKIRSAPVVSTAAAVIAVLSAGSGHWGVLKDASWEVVLSAANSILAVGAMFLIFSGCGRHLLRHVKAKIWSDCIIFISGMVCAAACIVHELLIVNFQGFTPDPLLRTVALLGAFLFGMALLFPHDGDDGPEPKNTEAGKQCMVNNKEEIQKYGWGASLALAFAIAGLTYLGGYFSIPARPDSAKAEFDSRQYDQPKYNLSPPAQYDELAKAFVCICSRDSSSPGGCGVFIGSYNNGERKIGILTAAHVASASFYSGNTNDVEIIPYHGTGKPDIRVKLNGTGAPLTAGHLADLSAIDVTPYFMNMVTNGWDVKYIPMISSPIKTEDERAVAGGFMLPVKFMRGFGIGLGTRIIAFGNAYELRTIPGMSNYQPLGVRQGVISARLDLDFGHAAPKGASTPIFVEADLYPGYSGGPVFAEAMIGPYAYPALIGITSGLLKSPTVGGSGIVRPEHSGFSFLSSIDAMLRTTEEIEELLKTAK